MIYGSVCSGIEAATVAWHPLGWQPAFFSEIEAFPCALLKHYYPDVPNRGDMTRFKEWPDATLDLLVGGTPCQAFSVAGLRKGLDDPRGNLTLVYLAIAAKYRPEWLVWENVPGVLSDGTGAFGAFLGGLAELGYGFAYRILDAQYFGVPQRRRRVFVVGHLGDWRRAAAVLFERESLQGNPAPSRKSRQGTPEGVARSLRGRSNASHREDSDNYMPVSPALAARDYKSVRPEASDAAVVVHSLRADGFDASEDGMGRGTPLVPIAYDERNVTSVVNRSNPKPGDPCHTLHKPQDTILAFSSKDHGQDAAHDVAPTLRAMAERNSTPNAGGQVAVALPLTSRVDRGGAHREAHGNNLIAQPVRSNPYNNSDPGMEASMHIQQGMQVRRLTPRECERLQGFPDDYTLIEVRGKPAADGPRYKALGNSMAVPVMRWIGERIEMAAHIYTARGNSE